MQTIAAPGAKVKARWVAFKAAVRHKPVMMTVADAYERAAAEREYHLGPRFYESADAQGAYRYWCMVDFDDEADPGKAMREAYRFCRDELASVGFRHGRDYVVGPSGSKGAKVFLRQLAPQDPENAEVWHTYLDGLIARYPTLDAQCAFHATHRGPWSAHPKHPERFQAMVADPLLLARDSVFVQGLTETQERPERLDEVLPTLDPASPTFLRWWGMVGLPWLDKKLDRERSKKRRSYRHRQIDIGTLLDTQGVAYQPRTAATGREYLRLKVCPFCNGRYKAAIMLRSGYLRCFRSGCEADDGLSLREWAGSLGVDLPAAKRLPSADAAAGNTLDLRTRPKVEPLPLFQAQMRLSIELRRRLSAGGDATTLVRATPGLGKTHATLEALADHITKANDRGESITVLFAAPTRELAEEAYQRSSAFELPYGAERSLIRGRDADNCQFPRHVAAVGSRGWSPGHAFCAGCPYQTGCTYYADMRRGLRASMIFATHEQAIHLLDDADLHVDVVVWDEDPTRALAHVWDLSLADVGAMQAPGTRGRPVPVNVRLAARALVRATELAWSRLEPNERRSITGHRLQALLDEAALAVAVEVGTVVDLDVLLRDASVDGDLLEPSVGKLAGVSIAEINRYPSRGVVALLGELVRDRNKWIAVGRMEFVGTARLSVDGRGRGRWFAQERNRPRSFRPDLILDAYGDADIYEAILGYPVDEVRVDATLDASTWWNVPVNTSRRAVADPESPCWRALDHVVGRLRRQGPVLVCCYKSAEAAVRKRYNEGESNLGLQPVEVYYYRRGRGIDSYKDHAACVLFGVPEPPEHAILARAALIYQDDPDPLDARRSTTNRRLWRSPRVQRVVDSMRESEAAQAAHRVRPVRNQRTVVSLGMVDYPSLPAPKRWTRDAHDDDAIAALERFATTWWNERGWWSSAVISPDLAVYQGERPDAGYITKLWRRMFQGEPRGALSPHHRFSGYPRWGDAQAAREWLREVAQAASFDGWEGL